MPPDVPHHTERRTLFVVEREGRGRLWLLFGVLLALICVTAWVGVLIVGGVTALLLGESLFVTWLFTPTATAVVLGLAFAATVVYWALSRCGARSRLLKAMHCRPLDPGDRYHERLASIAAELRIATGASRIDCVVVPTVGLNAFAFSDLRGAGVIGVTEGALARLSRPQLQAVVAHEFAHVLSGSYVTVTVSCLLFGIYSSVADDLGDATDAGGEESSGYTVMFAIPLMIWLRLAALGAAIINRAVGRQSEWLADAAAARFTRDPLALAEALRIIARHPGGAGYIPDGLAPLCIRSAGDERSSGVSWLDTHPPIEARIRALLEIAGVSPAEFERQATQAVERHDRREHWAPAPARGAAPAAFAPDGSASAAFECGSSTVAEALAAAGPRRERGAPAGFAASCPSCGVGLNRVEYEGVDILACERCGGRLVTTAQAGKLLARREAGFSDEQHRLADLADASGNKARRDAVLARGRGGASLIACPKCSASMLRRHYSYDYAVEVDRCVRCDLIWFGRDELEALQILVERQTG